MISKLIDGRARIDSDYGPVGLAAQGKGHLRGGFNGTLAAVLPEGEAAGCRISGASAYGAIKVDGEKPKFTGPLRLAALDCAKQKLRLADAALQLDMMIDKAFDGFEGKAGLTTGALALGGNRAASAQGQADATWRGQALTLGYQFAGKQVATPQAGFASLGGEGMLRARGGFSRIETEGTVNGQGLTVGVGLDKALAKIETGSESTLAAPLIARMRGSLRRELAGGSLTGMFTARRSDLQDSVVVPRAAIRGASGQALLSLSRLQVIAGNGPPQISANFATSGPGLPQISGRAERNRGRRGYHAACHGRICRR